MAQRPLSPRAALFNLDSHKLPQMAARTAIAFQKAPDPMKTFPDVEEDWSADFRQIS